MAWLRCCFSGGGEEESRQSNEMTKATESTTLMPYIPRHLLVEILLKLPIKSLIRLRCVSKSWLSLISDPHFTRNHLNFTKRILIITHYRRSHLYTADLGSAHKDSVAEKIDYISNFWTIIGSCNGLVCIKVCLIQYIVFNPLTRESKQIPYCDLCALEGFEGYCRYGFGYDSSSDDYKLVELDRSTVYVYSLRAGFWKKVQDYAKGSFYIDGSFHPRTRGLLLNGAIHWFCLGINSNSQSKIAAFDLVADKLSEIPLPTFFADVHDKCQIGVFLGRLCVKPLYYSDEFWVMKENGVEKSWTKFDMKMGFSCYDGIPLTLLKNDETLIMRNRQKLALYNTSEGTCRDLVLHGIPPHEEIFDAEVYAESLVSPWRQ
ncbi:F-box/kelch-repeat protein At3g06240-like [Cornus florida]|uniref:F-box/kelch-repeat protein At3g06240-like n=1 Tax=Cornus florida TaxID=4283 RepID=UPI00289D1AF9|nr:F-box/kelch-repeat protein At3g06240-like [Cornus florida]